MRSWLWQRLGWRGAAATLAADSDRVAMTRALAWLYLAGPTIGLMALALPHSADTSQVGVALDCIAAYLVAALILRRFDDLPVRAFGLALAFYTILISFAIVASGDDGSAYSFFYLWVGLYSAYFLTVRQAAVQGAIVALLYAAALALQQPAGLPLDSWLITIGTLVVSCGLVMVLRRRVGGLIETLSEAARTDALTGLANRRAFEEQFELELERARRSRRPMTLLIADLDRFKQLNDSHGHQAGDEALKRAAAVVAGTKRVVDTGARIGGEEFALIAPDCDAAGAQVLAERLRQQLRRAFVSAPVPLTVSVGIAVWPMHGASREPLMRAADEALYAAKRLGRDRAVVYRGQATEVLSSIDGDGSTSAPQLGVLLTLAEVLDMRDGGTAKHSQTVGRYSELLARELGLSQERVERVRLAGILHDIGKIAIPDAILRKPGPLTDEEWLEMRRHPEIGARLVRGELEDLRPWIAGHHERPDGRGYPLGLPGSEIPLEASILAVADAYEAMTSDRVYRAGLGALTARRELVKSAGTQFDQRVVGAFLRVLSEQARVPQHALAS
jgi:diguanylate cyclase (GGDEF)-like protein/putative nucleotidyltransferase with HDIG domain